MNKQNFIDAFKIIVVAIVAIVVAQLLQLEYAMSAGIVAILSVSPTKKETIRTARDRFIAFLLSLLIAYGCFFILGTTVQGFFAFLFLYIGLCQWKGWKSSMAVNSVLISHFVTKGEINSYLILNEFLLFGIGVGCGILVNLHLKKKNLKITALKNDVDSQISYILKRMAERIENNSLKGYDGKCFYALEDSLRVAKNLAQENFMNQFGNTDKEDILYLEVREKQVHILYNMYSKAKEINTTPITAGKIALFLRHLSSQLLVKGAKKDLLIELQNLHQVMKEFPLPVNREEFENRANLFVLMRDLEAFITSHYYSQPLVKSHARLPAKSRNE